MILTAGTRISLRRLDLDDHPFIYDLLNSPSWLRHIGDKQVHDADAARKYLTEGPLHSYATHGYGLLGIEDRADSQLIGLCGFLHRAYLDAPDLGFALLPAYQGRGLAFEAAELAIAYGKTTFSWERLYAIVQPGNTRSLSLLERLGFRPEGLISPEGTPLQLLSLSLAEADA